MNILLYNRTSSVTARALARTLGLTAKKVQDRNQNILVRYGNSTRNPAFVDLGDTGLNNAHAIELVADSERFSTFCVQQEINSVRYAPLAELDLSDLSVEEYPFLVRKKYHRGGLDIVVINNADEYHTFVETNTDRNYKYFVPYLRTDVEFRVHVLGTTAVKMFKKTNGDLTNGVAIRSSYKGWHYERVSQDSFARGKAFAVDTLVATGLSFGAVDMGYNQETKSYHIFEVNSAPGLNPSTLELYAEYIRNNMP